MQPHVLENAGFRAHDGVPFVIELLLALVIKYYLSNFPNTSSARHDSARALLKYGVTDGLEDFDLATVHILDKIPVVVPDRAAGGLRSYTTNGGIEAQLVRGAEDSVEKEPDKVFRSLHVILKVK